MEDLNTIAMEIILHAGDARTLAMQAMDLLAEFDLDEARSLLDKAKAEIILAHRVHTALLQKEITEEKNKYSILFAHAQDTLMAVNTEINLAQKSHQILSGIQKRLLLLEKGDQL